MRSVGLVSIILLAAWRVAYVQAAVHVKVNRLVTWPFDVLGMRTSQSLL